jgi:hypothetical protein
MSFTPGYLQSESRICAALSKIAYTAEDTKNASSIRNGITAALSTAATPYTAADWQLVWLGISPDYANLMYVAQNRMNPWCYAIVHRGTDWTYLDDAEQDLLIYDKRLLDFITPVPQTIYVAKGTMDGLNVLRGMTDQGADILTFVKNLATAATTDLDIYITGHSLGGALATLFTSWLLEMTALPGAFPCQVNYKTYTFASPTVGNADYANYFNSKVNTAGPNTFENFRIHSLQDLVPHAFDNLDGLTSGGIPMDNVMSDILGITIKGLKFWMNEAGVAYVHVGTDHPVDNANPNPAPPYPNPARNLKDYGGWVGYEHSLDTYLPLL